MKNNQMERKFRAWDKESKLMCHNIQSRFKITEGWEDWDLWGFFEEERFEIMQFVGLHDRNGKEIFEFDYIKHANGQISLVTWSEEDWGWSMNSVKNWNPKTFFDPNTDEVIGNKFENPELLEETK